MVHRTPPPDSVESSLDKEGSVDCMSPNNSGNSSRPTLRDSLRVILAGVVKHYSGTSLVLSGATIAAADLVKQIQSFITLADAADAEAAKWHDSVMVTRDAGTKLRPLLLALKGVVLNQFGNDLSALADFGYSPRKVSKPKAEVKAQAQVKAKATRVARNTVGPKKKLTIKSAPAPLK